MEIIIILLLVFGLMAAFIWGFLKSVGGENNLMELILFGKPVEIYENVFLIVEEVRSPQTAIVYDFSLYEDKGVVGMSYYSPHCNDESTPGFLPGMRLKKYKDGTIMVDL